MALPDDSSPHSPGGKGKLTVGQQTRCVPSGFSTLPPVYYFLMLNVHITCQGLHDFSLLFWAQQTETNMQFEFIRRPLMFCFRQNYQYLRPEITTAASCVSVLKFGRRKISLGTDRQNFLHVNASTGFSYAEVFLFVVSFFEHSCHFSQFFSSFVCFCYHRRQNSGPSCFTSLCFTSNIPSTCRFVFSVFAVIVNFLNEPIHDERPSGSWILVVNLMSTMFPTK